MTSLIGFLEDTRLEQPKTKKEVSVIAPQKFEDVEQLIMRLRKKEGVIIDLEDVPSNIAQRMLDFLSGAVFALEGSVNKLKNYMYIAIPKGVKITTVKAK